MKFLNNGTNTQQEIFLMKNNIKEDETDVEELKEKVEELVDSGVKTYHINSSAWDWEVSGGIPLYLKIAKPEGFNASKILFATFQKEKQSGHETGMLVQSSLQDAASWSWRIDLVTGDLVVVWPTGSTADYAPTVTFVSTL